MASDTNDTPRSLHVRIISQLPEPYSILDFPALPATLTVASLKAKIQDAVPLRPAPERQRLIHLGHVVAEDSSSLQTVFGTSSNSPHNLHMVIRDYHNPPSTSRNVNSVVHGPAQAPGASVPPLQPIDPRGPANIGTQQPQPTLIPPVQHAPTFAYGIHRTLNAPNSRGTTPNVTNQHPFAAPTYATPAQPQPNPLGIPAGPVPDLGALNQQAMQDMAQLQAQQQIMMLQQQRQHIQFIRAHHQRQQGYDHVPGTNANTPTNPAGQTGGVDFGSNPRSQPRSDANSNNNLSEPNAQLGQHNQGSSDQPQSGPEQTPTQNGPQMPGPFPFPNRFVTVNASFGGAPPFPMGFNPQQLFPHQSPNPLMFPAGFMQGPTNFAVNSRPSHSVTGPATTGRYHPNGDWHPSMHDALELLIRMEVDLRTLNQQVTHQQLLGIRSFPDFNYDSTSNELKNIIQVRNRAQEAVNSVIANDANTGAANQRVLTSVHVASLQTLHDRFSNLSRKTHRRIEQLRHTTNVDQGSHVDPSGRQTADQHVVTPGSTPARADITAYLLRSPQNQQVHAVVISPEGIFGNSRPSPTTTSTARETNIARPNNELQQEQMHRFLNEFRQNIEHHDRVTNNARDARDGVNQREVEANDDLPRQNGDVEVYRIIQPFFGTFWILVRVFAFIWFFSSGSTTRRTWLLVFSALIVFATQAGLFRRQLEQIRRHFEGILGLPQDVDQPANAQAAAPGAAQAAPGAGVEGNDGAQRHQRRPAPTPEATAERLLNQARERDQGRFREILRAVERAVALFFASLYPGIGEMHVAARERQRLEAEARANAAQTEAQALAETVTTPAPNTTSENSNADDTTTNQGFPEQAGPSSAYTTASESTSTSKQRDGEISQPHEKADVIDPQNNQIEEGSSTSANPTASASGSNTLRQRKTEAEDV